MKLFITNKDEFDNCDFDSKYYHVQAYNFLNKKIEVEQIIPLNIYINVPNRDAIVMFRFVNKKDDVYFFEYSGYAS
jgi:hypothetical protein